MVVVSKAAAPRLFIRGGSKPRRRAVAAVVLMMAVGAVVAVLHANMHNKLQHSVTNDAYAQSSAQLADWASTAVSPSAQFVVRDSDVADLLAANGLAVLRQGPGPTATYLVSVRSASTPFDFGGRSVTPIARFGSGARSLTVSIFSSMNLGAVRRSLSAGRQDRIDAARQLSKNPAVRTTAMQKRMLCAGHVDIRAIAFLAQLATQHQLRLTVVRTDPHETAAGTPAREITILVPSAQAVAGLVSATTGPYHPSIEGVSTTAKGTSVVLVWGLAPLANLVLR